jgi:hypothetical protein
VTHDASAALAPAALGDATPQALAVPKLVVALTPVAPEAAVAIFSSY